MVEIATVTCFWNSYRALQRLVGSIKDRFKAHLFIDGVYKNFPMSEKVRTGTGLSTDGSREYIERFCFDKPRRFKLLDAPFKTEYEKRMMYLDAQLLIRDLGVDTILIIDSDEYITDFNYEQFYDQCEQKIIKTHHGKWNVYGVMIQEALSELRPYESYQRYPHLWFKPWDMIYKPNSHYQYINCRWELQRHFNDNYCQIMIDVIDGIKITHDSSLRSKEYLSDKNEYHSWLQKYEQDLANKKLR